MKRRRNFKERLLRVAYYLTRSLSTVEIASRLWGKSFRIWRSGPEGVVRFPTLRDAVRHSRVSRVEKIYVGAGTYRETI